MGTRLSWDSFEGTWLTILRYDSSGQRENKEKEYDSNQFGVK